MNLQDYKDRVETLRRECIELIEKIMAITGDRILGNPNSSAGERLALMDKSILLAISLEDAQDQLAVVEEFGPTLDPKEVAMLAKLRSEL